MKLQRVYSATTRSDNGEGAWTRNLYDVSTGRDGVAFCIGSAQVLLSIDYGRNWKNLWSSETSLPYSHSHRICCTDTNTCWIPSFVLKEVCCSADLGETWESIVIPDAESVKDVFFVNPDAGWITFHKRNAQGSAGMMSTGNAGSSWVSLGLPFEGTPYRVFFVNESLGWALIRSEVTQNTVVAKSTDGGSSWDELAVFPEAYMEIYAINSVEIMLFGSTGTILKSWNGGGAWEVTGRCEVAVNAAVFVNDRGIAVGDRGSLLLTEDRGGTWIEQELDIGENLVAVDIFEEGSVVIASSSSIFLSGGDV
jgi:hypothetical protein